jgi:hypothetical protein
MGDPMAPSGSEGNSEGGGHARRIASRQAKRAGITRPQLLEMSRPGDFGTKEKTPIAHLYSLVAIRGLQWEKQGNISVDGFFSPVLTKLGSWAVQATV